MKKIKIIGLIILVLLCIMIAFGSCKKTKAYSLPNFSAQYSLSEIPGYDNGFALVYNISEMTGNRDILSIQTYNLSNVIQENYGFFINTVSNGVVNIGLYNRQTSQTISSFNLNYNSNLLYIQFLNDQTSNDLYLYFNFISINYNAISQSNDIFYLDGNGYFSDLSFSNTIDYYYFNPMDGYINYTLAWGVNTQYINSNNYLKSFTNLMLIDYYDDMGGFDYEEELTYGFDDMKPFLPLDQVKNDYYKGYNAGYDLGYLNGKNDGYNLGFNEGYDDGYEDGYDDGVATDQAYVIGYNAGYTNGYNAGISSQDAYDVGYGIGKNDGYNLGYDVGYEDGQAGNTAITPIFNTLSGVFTVVGSVMAIELVPHVPIGLFILVPLFFAVIGLVLWIWRKD